MTNGRKGRTPAPSLPAASGGREREPAPEPPTASIELAVLPAPMAAPVHLTVAREDPPEHLFRRLLSAYLAGARAFDVVERPAITARTRQIVREFCRRTRQPGIVRDLGSRIELVDLDTGTRGALEGRLQRLGELVLEFHRAAVESWTRLPLGDDGVWARGDDDIDREAWYLERCLALERRERDERSSIPSGAWTVVRSLERIADHAVTLGELGPRLAHLGSDTGLLRELRQFHRQAMAHLEEVLRNLDGSDANDLLDVGEALLAGGRALSERLLPAVGDGSMSPASAAAVARALEAIGRTVAYGQDIAQAFFDRALRFPAPSILSPSPVGAASGPAS